MLTLSGEKIFRRQLVVAVPGGAQAGVPSTACRAAGMWPDDSSGIEAMLAHELPADGVCAPHWVPAVAG